MTKKDYERAASQVQRVAMDGPYGDPIRANTVQEAFVEFFSGENPRFDAQRFRRACVPGANVRARGRAA